MPSIEITSLPEDGSSTMPGGERSVADDFSKDGGYIDILFSGIRHHPVAISRMPDMTCDRIRRGINRLQRLLPGKSGTAKIERASVMSEEDKNRIVIEANERFLRSGIEIRDVYGNLD